MFHFAPIRVSLWAFVSVTLTLPPLVAEELVVFDIEGGEARQALRDFATQSGVSLIYDFEDLSGVLTKPVHGALTPSEALKRMLGGGPLGYDEDVETGAFAVFRLGRDSQNLSQNPSSANLPDSTNDNPKQHIGTTMEKEKTFLGKLLVGLAGILMATHSPQLTAQAELEDEVFELSPFVVESSQDIGYLASSTLAGTRLRTDLSDVGAAISVVTVEFLQDTGSTDLRDILVYTPGTEVTGFGGNFSGSGFNNEQFLDTGLGNGAGTRLRGLASADLTRNYFRSLIPFESYNSDRLEINRGSNAILFGVGSPAGIINYSNNLASLNKDFGSIELKYARFGSERASLDVNRILVPKQLSARFSLLYDNEEFQQKPAFNKEERAYFTTTWEPEFLKGNNGVISHFAMRASIETGKIRANNPRSLPPQDYLSQWFELHPRQVAVGMSAKQTWDPTVNFNNPGAGSQLFVFQNTTRSPVVYFPDHTSAMPQSPYSIAGVVPNAVGNQNVVNGTVPVGSGFRNGVGIGPYRFGNRLRTSGDPLGNFIIQPVFTDDSIFDFRNTLIDGPNKHEDLDFDAVNLVVEQLLFGNSAGWEFVYDRQETERFNQSFLRGDSPWISMDVNTKLLDGTPNPNFGRPLTATPGTKGYSENELETLRFTAFYEFDFEDHLDGFWGRLLGKHTATLLWQSEQFDQFNSGGVNHLVTNFYAYGTSQNRTADNGKVVVPLSYLGPSIADRSSASGAMIPGIEAYRMNFPELIQGKSFYLRRQGVGHEFEEVTDLNVIRDDRRGSEGSWSGNKNRRNIDSLGLSLQSRFLQNHLIGTFGLRKEEVETYSVSAPVNPGDNNRLIDDPSFVIPGTPDLSVEETVTSWSVVAKTPESWLSRIKGVSAFNLHYNQSENFSPPSGTRFDALGNLISAPFGETEEYGFTVSLLENRAVLKVVVYETVQSDVTESSTTRAFNSIFDYHRLAFNAVVNGDQPDSDGDGFPDFYVQPPQFLLDLYDVRVNGNTLSITNPGVVATTDFVSEGMEFELHLNLTDNWTFTLNAAQQEASRSGSGDLAYRVLFEDPVQDGRSLFDLWNDPNIGGRVILFSGGSSLAEYSNRLTTIQMDNVRLQDGGPAQELREWRWNAATSYKFNDGVLNGLGVGAAARWQDEVAIGFPVIETANGDQIQDVNRPFMGPTEFNLDVWVNYSRTLFNGKIDWKLQLNVRNVLGDDDLIPVRAQPWGESAVFRIPESTVWTVSNRFSF